jgi:diphthine synthase
LGLHDEKGISLQGVEECKGADSIFLELYTNMLPGFSAKRFEKLLGKKVQFISRNDLEEEDGVVVLSAAEKGKTVFLVPGDPLIATTHVTLRIAAKKRGIETRVVHGASIISAVIGLSGLQNYKFGKTVTIPFPENFSETPYNVIKQNKLLGLHTLCLLDLTVDRERFLTINEALTLLSKTERRRKEKIVTPTAIVLGVARAGSKNPTVKAACIKELLKLDFGGPPQSLIFPGELHFMEAEALVALAGAPEALRRATDEY